jgi:hypothetical protein
VTVAPELERVPVPSVYSPVPAVPGAQTNVPAKEIAPVVWTAGAQEIVVSQYWFVAEGSTVQLDA